MKPFSIIQLYDSLTGNVGKDVAESISNFVEGKVESVVESSLVTLASK